ncbi:MAG TPA: GAF domain-containing protein, partial [Sumerlaeia bacterium]|nr:GAF domain-containing protein [Sumerlaeia bacterium]
SAPEGPPVTLWEALKYAGWALGLLAGLAAAGFTWSWSLGRRVARRTRELREELAERRRAEERLRQSEQVLRLMIESVKDYAIFRLDPEGRVASWNAGAQEINGYREEEILGKHVSCFCTPEDVEAGKPAQELKSAASRGWARDEGWRVRADGSLFWAAVAAAALRSPQGDLLGFVKVTRDMTERKRGEDQLRRSNRALRMLSECNQAVVRAREEAGFLDRICQIIVEFGEYRLAWVGFAEEGDGKFVRPVAWAGHEDGYLKNLEITWDDTPRGLGPTGAAIRTNSPVVCRDISSDPEFVSRRAEAVRRGYVSSIALPLNFGGANPGVLDIYAGETDRFDPDEIRLLKELAADVTFGIRVLRTRAERVQALEMTRRQNVLLDAANRVLEESLFSEGEEQVARKGLEIAREITGSRLGFICEINDAGQLDTIAISDTGWQACQVPKQDAPYSLDDAAARGIRGRVMKDGQSLLVNDPSSHPDWITPPEGHPPIHCFLGVPMKRAGKTIGMIALANKEGGFGAADREAVESLAVVITEALMRKRTEGLLLRSEAQYRDLAENMSEVIYRADPETFSPNYVNRSIEGLYGYAVDDWSRNPDLWRETIHPDDRERVLAACGEARRRLSDGVIPYRIVRNDGEVRWVEDHFSWQADTAGEPISMNGIVYDVTERKKAEDALRRSEEQFRQSQKLEALGRLAGG